ALRHASRPVFFSSTHPSTTALYTLSLHDALPILVTGLESGTLARLMDEWVRALGARPRIGYEPLGYEALRAANRIAFGRDTIPRSEEHTSELQSRGHLVCRLLLEKKKRKPESRDI